MKKLEPQKNKFAELSEELQKQEAVILSKGNNLLGQPIYAYIKFPMSNFNKLRDAMIKGENFKPSDYGHVLASGKGEPPEELKNEMRVKYGLVDVTSPEQKGIPDQEIKTPLDDFYDSKPMKGIDNKTSIELKKLGLDLNKLEPT